MGRPLLAVIAGTFTLRLSTGLTGALLVYYLAGLEAWGGERVDAVTVGLMGALFYASELLGSPVFGVLSDRLGHRRVMQLGPAFGAIAVVITALTVRIPVLGATRLLEGASTAASVPSILGYIAHATAADPELRGRAVARFEAATLVGLMAGFVAAGPLFRVLGPGAFLLNAGIYAVSFLVYRLGVPPESDVGGAGPAAGGEGGGDGGLRAGLARYGRILRGGHVWLLAPTWIAVNATIGLFTGQTLFQLVADRDPRFASQALMGRFDEVSVSVALGGAGLIFLAGLLWWGGRFRDLRRTTIVLYGILGGAVFVAAVVVLNHSAAAGLPVRVALVAVAASGLFVLAGATPAAVGLLADVTEAYPADRGAIMGLYSVFLGIGQIAGSLIGGAAGEAAGLDGIFLASLVLLGVALLPLSRLRRVEHEVGPRREPVPPV